MKKNNLTFLVAYLIAFLLTATPVAAAEKLLVYAAASTSSAISKIIDQYNQQNPNIQIKASFASSSTLAKQIEAGAPAHLYISANPKWMDYLQERQLIHLPSRLDLLHNKIVVITPKKSPLKVEMSKQFNLADKLKGKLCIGDPDHVPAGIYAKQALVSLTWWDKIKSSIVGTKDVLAALTLVERGECAAGIVYSTDADVSNKINLMAEFPANSHSPIVYPAATLLSAPASAQLFLDYLHSAQANTVFKKYGFTTAQ